MSATPPPINPNVKKKGGCLKTGLILIGVFLSLCIAAAIFAPEKTEAEKLADKEAKAAQAKAWAEKAERAKLERAEKKKKLEVKEKEEAEESMSYEDKFKRRLVNRYGKNKKLFGSEKHYPELKDIRFDKNVSVLIVQVKASTQTKITECNLICEIADIAKSFGNVDLLKVWVKGDYVDKYGNSKSAKSRQANISKNLLMKANWKNLIYDTSRLENLLRSEAEYMSLD